MFFFLENTKSVASVRVDSGSVTARTLPSGQRYVADAREIHAWYESEAVRTRRHARGAAVECAV